MRCFPHIVMILSVSSLVFVNFMVMSVVDDFGGLLADYWVLLIELFLLGFNFVLLMCIFHVYVFLLRSERINAKDVS